MGCVEDALSLVESRQEAWRLEPASNNRTLAARQHTCTFSKLVRTKQVSADRPGEKLDVLLGCALPRDAREESLPRRSSAASCS